MPKYKINAQKLVHLVLLLYLCIRKRNKQQLNPKTRKGTEIMAQNIYRIVEIDNNSEAKVYGKNFFGSKQGVENKIMENAFSLEIGGRATSVADYEGHRWNEVHIEGEGWLTATYCKKVILDSEICGEKYHKEFILGYVTYEVEA